MTAIDHNLDILMPFLVGSWILLIGASLWKPQRIKNAFLLMIALFFTFATIAGLFGDNMVIVMFALALICMFGLLCVPVLLIANGVITIRREGRSLANMLSLLLGIVVGLGEIAMFISILFNTEPGIQKDVNGVLLFIGCTVFYISSIILAFVVYNIFIQYIPKSINFDYVIIHGCGLINGDTVSPLLAARIDKAIDIYNRSNRKPILIPSGGRGSDEKLSEAAAMSAYLAEHGIPEEHIYKEDKSTTTMENLANCRDYIESRGGAKRYRIALVSSNYHVYRCLLYAEKLKMKCIGIGAHVAWYYWPSALLREFVAIFTRPKYILWTVAGWLLLVFLPFGSIFFG